VDNKAIHSSFDPEKRTFTLHLVGAWIDERSLFVARVACEERSNEPERSGDRLPGAARRVSVAGQNRCHWTLDLVFGEDDQPVRDRNAIRNLSTLGDLFIHFLHAHPSKQSLPKKRLQAILDPNFRTEIIRNLHAQAPRGMITRGRRA